MKHASPRDLSRLHDLLAALRALPGVDEMIQGTYHHGGVALLNFHAGSGGCVAQLREGGRWKRHPVNTPAECDALLRKIKAVLPAAKARKTPPPGRRRKVAHEMNLEPRERPRDPRLKPGDAKIKRQASRRR